MPLPRHIADDDVKNDVMRNDADDATAKRDLNNRPSSTMDACTRQDGVISITPPPINTSLPSPSIHMDDFTISSIGTDDDSFLKHHEDPILNETQVRLMEERDLIKKFDRAFINPSNECWFLVDAEFLTHAAVR